VTALFWWLHDEAVVCADMLEKEEDDVKAPGLSNLKVDDCDTL